MSRLRSEHVIGMTGIRLALQSVTASFALAIALAGTFAPASGCASEKKSKVACESKDDCAEGMICLGGQCTDPRSKALYTDPGNAVTPDKYKKELHKLRKTQEAQHQRGLDMDE